MLASSKECEKPLKIGAFRDSKGGTRTRDPRLMKPVPGADHDNATTDLASSLEDEPETSLNRAQQKAQHFSCEAGQAGDEGFNTSPKSKSETGNATTTPSPALQLSPELTQLVELWPVLPEPVRQSILLLIGQFGKPLSCRERARSTNLLKP